MCLFIQLCFLPLGFWHSTSGCEIDCLLLALILVLVMIWLDDKCFLPFEKKPKILPLIHSLFLCFFLHVLFRVARLSLADLVDIADS